MRLAIDEARASLREGNHGFGAVILKGDTLVARAHDTEETEGDPTAHAEMNALRAASRLLGKKKLESCILLSTHEPCPMCASAALWAGVGCIGYGYSIAEAICQGRKRIDIPCEEIVKRAGADVRLEKGLLRAECSILYNREVRKEIKNLKGAGEGRLRELDARSAQRRLAWYRSERPDPAGGPAAGGGDALDRGYRLLLKKLGISEREAPIVHREPTRLVFHSKNFCPTLEACIILGLDTRTVCRLSNEGSTAELIRQIDPRLRFSRNYDNLRPYAAFCEERIEYRT